MDNKKEWIEYFRSCMRETEINDELYSDKEVLEYGKGMLVQVLTNLEHEWQFEMYFKMLITFFTPTNFNTKADTSLFESRAKKQKN